MASKSYLDRFGQLQNLEFDAGNLLEVEYLLASAYLHSKQDLRLGLEDFDIFHGFVQASSSAQNVPIVESIEKSIDR